MMEKLQRFGGAMITPVLLFAFFGIVVGLTTFFKQELIFGSLAAPDSLFFQIMDVIQSGGWTVFNQINLLFAIGLPIGLANKQQGRAAMESFVIYMVFNYFLNSMLGYWGHNFGVDFSQEPGAGTGLATVAGVKTLDTGMIGALIIAGIAIFLHNRYFDTKLPEWLGTFRGSPVIVAIGFVLMLPVAFAFMIVWPQVQGVIANLQSFLANAGYFGVWLFAFLERLLIPTGMHHLLAMPFQHDSIVVNGGILNSWVTQLSDFAGSSASLRSLFPEGGFTMYGLSKLFAPIGISAAFIQTARPEKKQEIIGLMIPVALTAIVAGITEPIEFTFLFIAPQLYLVHSIIAATLVTSVYLAGVSGYMTGGLIEITSYNFLPLSANHWQNYLILLVIGLMFSGIWFISFRYMILKGNLETPGREALDQEAKLMSKKEYREIRQQEKDIKDTDGSFGEDTSEDPTSSKEPLGELSKAEGYLLALGGAENIDAVTNCMTRLRVTVKDPSLVSDESEFKKHGAFGLMKKDKNVQVIDGTSVLYTREEFEELL